VTNHLRVAAGRGELVHMSQRHNTRKHVRCVLVLSKAERRLDRMSLMRAASAAQSSRLHTGGEGKRG